MKYGPRQCSECGSGMWHGWISEVFYWCSAKCLYADGYTEEELERDVEADLIYWTAWEEEALLPEEGESYLITNGQECIEDE